jgi:hypothetical protein
VEGLGTIFCKLIYNQAIQDKFSYFFYIDLSNWVLLSWDVDFGRINFWLFSGQVFGMYIGAVIAIES